MLPGMTAWLSTRLVWASCGLSVRCAVVGAFTAFPNRRVTPIPELLLIAGALSYSGVGALIAMRQPANRIGWLLLLIGVLSSVCLAASGYALFSLVIAPGSLPLGIWGIWTFSWLIWLVLVAIPLVLMFFPGGRLPSQRCWGRAALLVAPGGLAARPKVVGPRGPRRPPSTGSAGPNPAGLDILAGAAAR